MILPDVVVDYCHSRRILTVGAGKRPRTGSGGWVYSRHSCQESGELEEATLCSGCEGNSNRKSEAG